MFKLSRLHISFPALILSAVDLVALFLAIVLGLLIRHLEDFYIIWPETSFIWQIATFVIAGWLSLFMLGAYRKPIFDDVKTLLVTILASNCLLFLLSVVFLYVFQTPRIWIGAFLPAITLGFFFLSITHYAFNKFFAFKTFRKKILILGTGRRARMIDDFIESRHPMIAIHGFVPLEGETRKIQDHKISKPRAKLLDYVQQHAIDEILVAVDDNNDRKKQMPWSQLLECRTKSIPVIDISTFLEQEEGYIDIDTVDASWLIFSTGFKASTRLQMSLKRMFDVAAALLIFALTLPFLLVSSALILTDGAGRILYRQERIGIGGRRFSVLKLRTMKIDAEVDGIPQWSHADDDRVTRVGAFLRRSKLDELPQLWNVLKGDMSMVGPRPERPFFVENLANTIPYYNMRHSVKPGLSGWAQINFPYGSSIEQAKRKLEYDLYYIKNYSLLLDILILLQTVRVILLPEKDWREHWPGKYSLVQKKEN